MTEPDFDLWDETDRLVYADWLEEQGRAEEAALCRSGRCLTHDPAYREGRWGRRVVRLGPGHLDPFTRAYLDAALWSSTDDDGDPLDQNYGLADLAPEALDAAVTDCRRFRQDHGGLFEGQEGRAGHDFWLSRNGHGSGFFDGDYGGHEDELQDAAEAWGAVDPYVGDDGVLYFFP